MIAKVINSFDQSMNSVWSYLRHTGGRPHMDNHLLALSFAEDTKAFHLDGFIKDFWKLPEDVQNHIVLEAENATARAQADIATYSNALVTDIPLLGDPMMD